ncbi:MAG: PAS domain-containing hybrid sensor histidine kinase/response regulator [Usitatibacter sp.]
MNARPAPAAPSLRSARRASTADHFRLMADYAPVMIWLASPDRRSVYFNRLWLEFTGRALSDELGFGWTGGLHPDDAAACLEAYSRAFDAREPFEVRYRLRDRGGEYRWIHDRGVPLFDDGELAGFVGSCLDITDRLAAEQEARAARAREDEKRTEQLEQERAARAHAESATLARDQFLAIVSHELRSPLNGIKSWTHVLENHLRDGDAMVRRAIAGIMIGVEHQVRLIEDLLDVTRAMSGNLGLVKQGMALLPVLADAVESLRAMAAEKGLSLVTRYELGEGEIHGDPDRVHQIFANLLTNAIKFTPRGGTIEVSAAREGAMARVTVRDDGVGIAPEFLPYLFDPFRQADPGDASRRQEGLGLGLALVQRLAELHGGYATCRSDGLDRGATFDVYLPLRGESGARVTIGHSMHDSDLTSPLPSLGGIRVFLVDDQREARESLAALLEQAGACVVPAESGQRALELLKAGPRAGATEVIVCDIAMPGEDGYATLRHIREWEKSLPAGNHRPAIALSAFTQREDRIRALAEGFQMHLTKPVAPAELVIVIASVARGMRV